MTEGLQVMWYCQVAQKTVRRFGLKVGKLRGTVRLHRKLSGDMTEGWQLGGTVRLHSKLSGDLH